MTEIVPFGVQADLAHSIQDHYLEASKPYGVKDLQSAAPNIQAEIVAQVLENAETVSTMHHVVQGFYVVWIARNNSWMFHPEGFDKFRDYLKFAGLHATTITMYNALAMEIVPFVDYNGIDINQFLSVKKWPHLITVIPALRKAVADDDIVAVKAILEDVALAKTRDNLRDKYANHREVLGRATSQRSQRGQIYIVVMVDNEAAATTISNRLHGYVDWTLSASLNQDGSAVILDA